MNLLVTLFILNLIWSHLRRLQFWPCYQGSPGFRKVNKIFDSIRQLVFLLLFETGMSFTHREFLTRLQNPHPHFDHKMKRKNAHFGT